jgi:hypothetical protein
MNPEQVRGLVIRPALKKVDLWSDSAENILMGTIAHESAMGTYLKQVRGPAMGIYQIEPNTHTDIWANFLKYRGGLSGKVRDLICPLDKIWKAGIGDMGCHVSLITNLAYATVIARIVYLRAPTQLPDAKDLPGMAAYWKKYYNTIYGAGTEEQFIEHYTKYVG